LGIHAFGRSPTMFLAMTAARHCESTTFGGQRKKRE